MSGATEDALEATIRSRLDQRTLDVLARRARSPVKSRGSLVRRSLPVADVVGLSLAFLLTKYLFDSSGSADSLMMANEYVVVLAMLPVWLVFAKLHRLDDHDSIREGGVPRSSAELGLEVVRMIEAVDASLERNGARVAVDAMERSTA